MKKLTFIALLAVVIGICFTVSAFADFYVIPVKKCGIKVTSTIVPKTGETNCYYDDGSTTGTCTCGDTNCTAGQDGDLKKGYVHAVAAPSSESPYTVPNWTGDRFTDNSDGTISDNLTSLVWLKDANSLSGNTNWASALSYCNSLEAGGHIDWRLPNFNELRSLDDTSQSGSCLPSGHPFTDVQSGYYWSSTTYESHITINAWGMDMNNGHVGHDNKTGDHPVWPVRSDN